MLKLVNATTIVFHIDVITTCYELCKLSNQFSAVRYNT